MVRPNLIHKTPISIEVLDLAATIFDEDAREPVVHAARKTTVIVDGQPRWIHDALDATRAIGATQSRRGYVLFRKADLDAAGIALKVNDRLTMQGTYVGEVYVTHLEPTAHYADQGGAALVKAHFTDRLPAKER